MGQSGQTVKSRHNWRILSRATSCMGWRMQLAGRWKVYPCSSKLAMHLRLLPPTFVSLLFLLSYKINNLSIIQLSLERNHTISHRCCQRRKEHATNFTQASTELRALRSVGNHTLDGNLKYQSFKSFHKPAWLKADVKHFKRRSNARQNKMSWEISPFGPSTTSPAFSSPSQSSPLFSLFSGPAIS